MRVQFARCKWLRNNHCTANSITILGNHIIVELKKQETGFFVDFPPNCKFYVQISRHPVSCTIGSTRNQVPLSFGVHPYDKINMIYKILFGSFPICEAFVLSPASLEVQSGLTIQDCSNTVHSKVVSDRILLLNLTKFNPTHSHPPIRHLHGRTLNFHYAGLLQLSSRSTSSDAGA